MLKPEDVEGIYDDITNNEIKLDDENQRTPATLNIAKNRKVIIRA